jgi:hypothetical protein
MSTWKAFLNLKYTSSFKCPALEEKYSATG